MDRKALKLPFTEEKAPEWICPSCDEGVLQIKESTFAVEERGPSKRARECDAWEPEWIENVYSCLLLCSNTACGEMVASSGVGSVDWYNGFDENGTQFKIGMNIFTQNIFNLI